MAGPFKSIDYFKRFNVNQIGTNNAILRLISRLVEKSRFWGYQKLTFSRFFCPEKLIKVDLSRSGGLNLRGAPVN